MNDASLRDDLLSMAAEDERVRTELARDGTLFDGYHPGMREVHERNADRLAALLEQHGWPTRALVGEDGVQAAWLVAQHAISRPALQRQALALLRAATSTGEVPAAQVAMLEDRIRCNEGRPQRYGTQFDWDEQGRLSPLPIEDEAGVDARRREVGLGPLASEVERRRERARREGDRPPRDWHARQREIEDWRRSVGWLR